MLYVWGKNEKQFVLVVECIGFRYGEYFQESKMATVAILDIRPLATFDLFIYLFYLLTYLLTYLLNKSLSTYLLTYLISK